MCVLYERLNIQEGIVRKGEAAILEKDEEARKLRIVLSEVKRKLEIRKTRIPQVLSTDAELKGLETELEKLRNTSNSLSEKMQNPLLESRCRHLKGEDPELDDLMAKIRKFEQILAHKEVSL